MYIYPSIQLTFSRILMQKGLYFDQTLCHKVISFIQYTLSFITSFFEEIFSQSRISYEIVYDIMVLSDPAKSGLKSTWCMD